MRENCNDGKKGNKDSDLIKKETKAVQMFCFSVFNFFTFITEREELIFSLLLQIIKYFL